MDGNDWYEYCRSNPLRYVDPDGMQAYMVGLSVSACLLAGLRIELFGVWDSEGNYGILVTGGVSVGGELTLGFTKGKFNVGKTLSPTKIFSVPGANTIYDLKGYNRFFSGSIIFGNVAVDRKGKVNLSLIAGIGIGCSYNWTWSLLIPISDGVKFAELKYMEFDDIVKQYSIENILKYQMLEYRSF